MIKELDDYDWKEAFGYAGERDTDGSADIRPAFPTDKTSLAPFKREDVSEIYAKSEGENDGPDWLIYGKLKDGRFFYLEAGCDYAGWDCRAGGTATVADSKEELEHHGIPDRSKERLNIKNL